MAPSSLLAVGTNPAIDRVIAIDVPPLGVVKARESLETPGGKAVHVAMIAAQLGAEAAVLTTTGGRNGELLARLLAGEGLPLDAVTVAGETRGTYTVVSVEDADLVEFHEPAAALDAGGCDRLVARLAELASPTQVVAVCGSLPPGTPQDLHARLVATAKENGAFTILDCSTPGALRAGLAAGPDLVAPNLAEALAFSADDCDAGDGPDDARILSLTDDLLQSGAAAVWLSLGAFGSVLAHADRAVRLSAPAPLRTVNAVGCGDALLGGLVAALIAGAELESAAELGVAAATEKLRHLHPGRIDRKRAEALRREVEFSLLRGGVVSG